MSPGLLSFQKNERMISTNHPFSLFVPTRNDCLLLALVRRSDKETTQLLSFPLFHFLPLYPDKEDNVAISSCPWVFHCIRTKGHIATLVLLLFLGLGLLLYPDKRDNSPVPGVGYCTQTKEEIWLLSPPSSLYAYNPPALPSSIYHSLHI